MAFETKIAAVGEKWSPARRRFFAFDHHLLIASLPLLNTNGPTLAVDVREGSPARTARVAQFIPSTCGAFFVHDFERHIQVRSNTTHWTA